MPYVSRDEANRITGVFTAPQYDGQEFINGSPVIDPHYTSPTYPSEAIMLDQGTGLPVKVAIKNGEVYQGGIDETIT